MIKSITHLGIAIVFLISSAGCSMGSFVMFFPQSHFSYPNSNVVPIGPATGETSTVSLFIPVFWDADMQEEALAKAIKQKGGDMLIDYVGTTEITMFPLMFINVYMTTYKVEGTVAKMELGKQILH